jgi:hypothetical protein
MQLYVIVNCWRGPEMNNREAPECARRDEEDMPISIHEIGRRAPLGFWAKADNARFVAYLLWQAVPPESLSEAISRSNYHGTPSIALHEGFRRESALAFELIVKAVIAQKIELRIAPSNVRRVSAVHNLPRLWAEAGLPTLSNEDLRRLLIVKSLLSWSGRYAAPKTDDQFYQEKTDYEALGPPEPLYSKMWDWENFDRLYQIANGELFEMRAHYGLSPRSADLGLRRRRTRPIA